MTVTPWPVLPRTDARRTLTNLVQIMLTPDDRACITHGVVREGRRTKVRITIFEGEKRIAAMADIEDLRPTPWSRPRAVGAYFNRRNPIVADSDFETAPPSTAGGGYALFAGPDSIIPAQHRRDAVKDTYPPPPMPPGWKPGDPLGFPPPPPPIKAMPFSGPLPRFLRGYAKDREGAKLRPYPPVVVTLMLAVLDGIGRVLDQIDMARLAAGVRTHAAHIDRRQERHLKAWEALAAKRATIPPLQN